ncbi:type III PLP-dependent enzyme [Yinghuangia sp. ASG 101]|uniref:type III PLP-dependent enzyme n=1 Tax=Yinghuangia sp. ASG 101 TaxID=2896848 RepID=UPI001E3FC20D|nr:type III PLP-dependent enzyme [Yinghuangia sp. ASG 101]UGQ15642.1 type III PLP-dependent enzyme [Yinghuangia sp. ASG 101]
MVRAHAHALPDTQLPAYVHDIDGLARHAADVSTASAEGASGAAPRVELYYAAKANPAPEILRALAPHVHGIEVASGGELAHVRGAAPGVPIAFGGPGKTDGELDAVVATGVHRLHVESEHELRRAAAFARAHGRAVDVLLRANPPVDVPGGPAAVPLAMGGRPSPFGMDPDALDRCARVAADEPRLRLLGIHAHLASGLDAAALGLLAEHLLDWAVGWAARNRLDLRELNVGGGMAVDYHRPEHRFDWRAYGKALAATAARPNAPVLRIEPGRALTAYHGWYVTDILDVKHSRGETFAVVRGGTHHLRTPAARGHSQPLAVLPRDGWPHPWPRPGVRDEPVTFVGQLCTPKDVLAAHVPVPGEVRVGDRVAFAMAGAYAWNISHRDFLMHPPPTFHYPTADGTHLEQAGRRT